MGVFRTACIMEQTKLLVAAFLTLQVACMVLVLRYSMVTTTYCLATAVILGEVVKLFVSILGMIISAYNTGNPSAHIGTEVEMSIEPAGLLKMSVPSLLYLVQNNLLFFAMSNMDAS